MRVKQLDHLNLSVASFDQSTRWYGRVFGFELVEEGVQDGVRWGVIRSGDAMLCIYERPEGELHDRFALEKRGLHGLNHFGLRITDAAEWGQTMEREKIQLLYGGPIRWPHSIAWYVTDPTGYEIEVALWDDDAIEFDPMA